MPANRLLIGPDDKIALLLQLLQEDFATGVTIIDPDGRFAEAAADIVPPELTDNVFYFDPSNLSRPPGLNVLDDVPPDERDNVRQALCEYFEAMFVGGWGHQSNFIFANCIRLLLDTPGSTFLGVLKLLQDPEYPKYLNECLANCSDPVVKKNWAIIGSWDNRQYQAAMAPLQNKIGTLLLSPVIRNIVCQEHSTFSLTGHKIIIANLSRAKIGDLTARLLGSLLITRAETPVYINDLGFFSSDYLATLFPKGGYTVALRFLTELKNAPALKQAAPAIEDKYIFRTTSDDAEELAPSVGVQNPGKLVDLLPNQVYAFEKEFKPERPPSLGRLNAIRKRSVASHTRPRKQVEAAVARFLTTA